MSQSVRFIYTRIVLLSSIFIGILVGFFFSGFSRNKADLYRRIGKRFLRVGFFLGGIKISVKGVLPKGHIIIASNHRSLLDTLAIISFLDRPFFVITEPLGAMPNLFIRRGVEVLGYLPIIRDKEDQEKHKIGMAPNYVVPLCVERIKKGESLVIYPEAHHETGKGFLRFKTGAIRTALESGVPLIPMAITGSEKVITPDRYKIHPGDVHIYIGKPMDLSSYHGKQEDRKLVRRLTGKLKKEIASLITDRGR